MKKKLLKTNKNETLKEYDKYKNKTPVQNIRTVS